MLTSQAMGYRPVVEVVSELISSRCRKSSGRFPEELLMSLL